LAVMQSMHKGRSMISPVMRDALSGIVSFSPSPVADACPLDSDDLIYVGKKGQLHAPRQRAEAHVFCRLPAVRA
jgi:hypothetical protein